MSAEYVFPPAAGDVEARHVRAAVHGCAPSRWLTALLGALVCSGAMLAPSAVRSAPDPASQPTPSKDSDPFPITVRATPEGVLTATLHSSHGKGVSATPLIVSGTTLPAGRRTVVITIKSEEETWSARKRSSQTVRATIP